MSPDGAEADVAIIGAGPAGAATAVQLGQLGVGNVVLVDRADFPRDKTCGSAVSPKGIQTLQDLGVWPEVERCSYRISGLRLVTPGGREAYVSGGDAAAAIVCCRRTLDHLLLQRALGFKVRFVPNFYAKELIQNQGRVAGFRALDGREVRARYTVVTDGAHSLFTGNQAPKRFIQAIMGWWEGVPFRANHVEMIFDSMLRPLYGWLFPETDTRVNIGICYEDPDHRHNARHLFAQFLDKHFQTRLARAAPLGDWKGHPISYSYRIGKLYSPGRLVVGEAGRLTHPATAEGIYQGLRSGILAAEALGAVLSRRSRETEAFADYEASCRKTFSASFWGAKLWRAAIRTPLLDWVVAAGERPAVRNTVARLMANM